MATWIGYKEYGATRGSVEASMRAQYAKLDGVQLAITDTAFGTSSCGMIRTGCSRRWTASSCR